MKIKDFFHKVNVVVTDSGIKKALSSVKITKEDMKVVGDGAKTFVNVVTPVAKEYVDFEKQSFGFASQGLKSAVSVGGSIFKNLEQDMMIAGGIIVLMAGAYVYSSFKK